MKKLFAAIVFLLLFRGACFAENWVTIGESNEPKVGVVVFACESESIGYFVHNGRDYCDVCVRDLRPDGSYGVKLSRYRKEPRSFIVFRYDEYDKNGKLLKSEKLANVNDSFDASDPETVSPCSIGEFIWEAIWQGR